MVKLPVKIAYHLRPGRKSKSSKEALSESAKSAVSKLTEERMDFFVIIPSGNSVSGCILFSIKIASCISFKTSVIDSLWIPFGFTHSIAVSAIFQIDCVS